MSVTREKLFDEIWADPIIKVSKRYGVSDSYLVRILKSLNIPRPPRGYWAMVAAGIHPEKPSLPAAKLGDAITWSRDGQTEFATSTAIKTKTIRSKQTARISTHGLVREAREHFKNLRDSKSPYLKPYKKLAIDLVVSQDTLERGLSITSQFYLLLEDIGNRVRIAPYDQHIYRAEVDERENTKPNRFYSDLWHPYRPTVVYIQDVVIGLTIFEISEEVEVGYLNGEYIPMALYLQNPKIKSKSVYTFTTTQNIPSGRLCIQAYSTHPGTKWLKQWRESKPGEFSKTLKTIVNELCEAAPEIAQATKVAIQEAEERKRQWDIEREKDRLEAEERRRVKNLKDSQDELFSIIEAWAEAKRIDEFFQDAQFRANELSLDDRQAIEARLTEARKLLGTLDALERFKAWKSPENR
ncbi:MAG: hypothetical protein Q8N02_11440 [Methylotenera sp.]|nr:hypothetical protein [Methylotenera sp.]MDO9234209.1 hypothetical protein [Methylotenera sp.]MDP2403130.1 hypothetical protein [Methylotenera sp.]MDP3096173.1 hypothetical protein [Methylotenera sp.]MDZ4223088.1 hypothetical protein [Methylotenera sp.]